MFRDSSMLSSKPFEMPVKKQSGSTATAQVVLPAARLKNAAALVTLKRDGNGGTCGALRLPPPALRFATSAARSVLRLRRVRQFKRLCCCERCTPERQGAKRVWHDPRTAGTPALTAGLTAHYRAVYNTCQPSANLPQRLPCRSARKTGATCCLRTKATGCAA
jgi:hypothetical protein